MSRLNHLEKKYFEELFAMDSGYVLEFTNESFERFFKTTTGDDIYDEKYSEFGNSKAKRLRSYWDNEPEEKVGLVLKEMMDIWVFEQHKKGINPNDNPLYHKCREIVGRLRDDIIQRGTEENEFLKKNFGDVSFSEIKLDNDINTISSVRLKVEEPQLVT